MAFVDRKVQYPNRVRLTPVSGQTNVYDMKRAEGTVTTAGTPLNAKNLNNEIKNLITAALAAFTIDKNNNVKVRNLQRGRVTVATKASPKKTVKKHVNFPKAFTSEPSVVATMRESTPTSGSISVATVTTTGFDLYVYRTGAYDTTVDWIAVI